MAGLWPRGGRVGEACFSFVFWRVPNSADTGLLHDSVLISSRLFQQVRLLRTEADSNIVSRGLARQHTFHVLQDLVKLYMAMATCGYGYGYGYI